MRPALSAAQQRRAAKIGNVANTPGESAMIKTARFAGKLAKFGLAGVLALCGAASVARAGSVMQPGETVGLAVGAPLPQGLYFIDTWDWGVRSTSPEATALGVNIPVLAWSTPWTILGGRVEILGAAPELEAGVVNTTYNYSMYNPIVLGMIAWDLGNGFGFSYGIGNYFDVSEPLAWSTNSLRQDFALSYTKDDWNLSATLAYGIDFDQFVPGRGQVSPCVNPTGVVGGCNPDWLNLDLTATHKFGKWELGPVAFGSWDLSTPVTGYLRQSQFAVGGLVGYNFGPVDLQLYATTTAWEQNYGGYDTRAWFRLVVPLWSPTVASASPLPVKALPPK
jgi:hypothetical protein